MMKMSGILFDVDGVLVDSYDAHLKSWQLVAAKDGFEFFETDFSDTFGMSGREIIDRIWKIPLGTGELRERDEHKEIAYREIVRDEFPAMPGAVAIVRRLHAAGMLIGIGSSGPRENVELAVEKLGIGEYLGAVVSGSDIRYGKPDPEVYLKGAEKLGLPCDRCVVIDDAIFGIESAHAAGMKCIAFHSRGHELEEYLEAEMVFDDLGKITPEIIESLLRRDET